MKAMKKIRKYVFPELVNRAIIDPNNTYTNKRDLRTKKALRAIFDVGNDFRYEFQKRSGCWAMVFNTYVLEDSKIEGELYYSDDDVKYLLQFINRCIRGIVVSCPAGVEVDVGIEFTSILDDAVERLGGLKNKDQLQNEALMSASFSETHFHFYAVGGVGEEITFY